jgi:hypothetical protein
MPARSVTWTIRESSSAMIWYLQSGTNTWFRKDTLSLLAGPLLTASTARRTSASPAIPAYHSPTEALLFDSGRARRVLRSPIAT